MRTGPVHQQAHHPSPDRPTTIPTPLPSPTPHPMTTRAKNGIYKPNSKYFSNFYATNTTTIPPLPKDPASAIRDPNWKNAMLDEFNALVANKTWELLPRPPDVNVIRSMWIFCRKRKSDGSFQRHKAHLVGDEKTQQLGVDCDEIFSPVVKPATIRTVLSIAISKSWHIHQLDVKNAFLHGYLNETVYMHQPMGFCDKGCPDHVYLLNKSLYGLKLAPRAWYQRFADFVATIGFSHSKSNHLLFIYSQGLDMAYILLYVNDIILTASLDRLRKHFMALLGAEFAMSSQLLFGDCYVPRC